MPNGDNELRGLPKDDDPTSPFKNRGQDDLVSPSDRDSARRSQELEKKSLPDSSANCEAFRDKLRKSSITQINLNAAPRYGQGMNDDPEKAEKLRLDFAASSEVRQWCDRHGRTVVEGRMIDLVNEQVVLDINGSAARFRYAICAMSTWPTWAKSGTCRSHAGQVTTKSQAARLYPAPSSGKLRGCATSRCTLKKYNWSDTVTRLVRSCNRWSARLTSLATSPFCRTRWVFIRLMNASTHSATIDRAIVLLTCCHRCRSVCAVRQLRLGP